MKGKDALLYTLGKLLSLTSIGSPSFRNFLYQNLCLAEFIIFNTFCPF